MDKSVLQRAGRKPIRKLGLAKSTSHYTLWHSSTTHLIEDGSDIRAIRELLGHRDVKTTMMYTHVLSRGGQGVYSRMDRL